MKINPGFTLVELLVVMAILAILSTVALGQFTNSQKKARDTQRKSDLDNVARALEMYYNDNKTYPASSEGKIAVDGGATIIDWTTPFQQDVGSETIVYMKKLPCDPDRNWNYCYWSDGGGFKLYAKLENDKDFNYCLLCYECNGNDEYHYGITSSNLVLECE